jgi:plastocyanin
MEQEMSKRVLQTLGAIAVAVLIGTPVAAALRLVSQKDKQFSVTTLTVKAGEKVTFRNDDKITHNVFTISKGMEFNLKIQPPGTSTDYTFAKPGVAELQCAFHPKMKLTVTIKK